MADSGFSSIDKENIEILARVSFDSLDVNRTGKITKAQFKEGFTDFITSAGFSRPDELTINEYFKKFDADHSGDLDFEEYKVYIKDYFNKINKKVI